MKVELIGDKGKTNNFEIVWNGQLMHSKSVRDEGFPKPNKLEAIVADVLKVVPASASGLRDPEETAVVQVHLTPAQVQQLGANPEQAKALLRRGFARPAGVVRFAATLGLDIGETLP